MEKEHIGDGVYASYDGYQLWLETERDTGVERIALEPSTYERLLDYVKRLKGNALA